MVSAERLYWCASILLYSVLGDWYFLFDHEGIQSPPDRIPSGPDKGQFESICRWALEQNSEVPEAAVEDIDPYDVMDGNRERWLTEIWAKTRAVHESYPQLERWQWMYYLYYQSIAQIVGEFVQLVQQPPIASSIFYQGYLEGENDLQVFKDKMINYWPSTGNATVDSAMKQIILAQAEKSAADWRAAVFSWAKDSR